MAVNSTEAFELLGVPLGATPQEVKQAWWDKAKSAHPDTADRPNIVLLTRLQAAFRVAHRAASVCPECRGTGKVSAARTKSRGFYGDLTRACPTCAGSGARQ